MFGFGLNEIDDEAFLESAAGSRPVCAYAYRGYFKGMPYD